MITRRRLITAAASLTALIPLSRFASAAESMQAAIQSSSLIYLTPMRTDGAESRCQAEVWFAADEKDLFVVTATPSWRVRAVKMGLARARIWVGDLGVWTSTDGKYKTLPSLMADASIIDDKIEQARILALFGSKYSMQWLVWGRRFRNGLEEGSRTMLRYRPVG